MNDLNLLGIKLFCYALVLGVSFNYACGQSTEGPDTRVGETVQESIELIEPLPVERCDDFKITGNGNNQFWNTAEWNFLTKIDKGGRDYETKFKVLASSSGIYVLFYGEDDKITTEDYGDMDKIWNGDVFEVFFHPDPRETVYYEYEVNQFEKQLVLTISDSDGGLAWIPFNEYGKGQYGIKNKVEISGGARELNGKIRSWSAEVFLSYRSLGLLPDVPPKSGTVWNANFCRLDHDTGSMVKWSWTPTIESSLHELDRFRSIIFR